MCQFAALLQRRNQPGDWAEAERLFRRMHEINEELLRESPNSAPGKKDVAAGASQFATFLQRRNQPGDQKKAKQLFRRMHELNEELLRESPQSTPAMQDVAAGAFQFAIFFQERNQKRDGDEAEPLFRRALEIDLQLLELHPLSKDWVSKTSFVLSSLARLLRDRGDAEEAGRVEKQDFETLQSSQLKGAELDARILSKYDMLRRRFGTSSKTPANATEQS